MKWYWRILIDVVVLLLIGFVAFAIWWNTPLGPPLDLNARGLPADYTRYWWWMAGLFGLLGLLVAAELGLILREVRLWRQR